MKAIFKIVSAKPFYLYIEIGKFNSTPSEILKQLKNHILVDKYIIIQQQNSKVVILVRGSYKFPEKITYDSQVQELPTRVPFLFYNAENQPQEPLIFKIFPEILELSNQKFKIETNLNFTSKSDPEYLRELLTNDLLLEKAVNDLILNTRTELLQNFFRLQHIFTFARFFFDKKSF
jgi:hypothetical protein